MQLGHTYFYKLFFNLMWSLTPMLHFCCHGDYFNLSEFSFSPDFVILCNNDSSMLWVMTKFKFIITLYILKESKTEPGGMPPETFSQTDGAPSSNTFKYWLFGDPVYISPASTTQSSRDTFWTTLVKLKLRLSLPPNVYLRISSVHDYASLNRNKT